VAKRVRFSRSRGGLRGDISQGKLDSLVSFKIGNSHCEGSGGQEGGWPYPGHAVRWRDYLPCWSACAVCGWWSIAGSLAACLDGLTQDSLLLKLATHPTECLRPLASESSRESRCSLKWASQRQPGTLRNFAVGVRVANRQVQRGCCVSIVRKAVPKLCTSTKEGSWHNGR